MPSVVAGNKNNGGGLVRSLVRSFVRSVVLSTAITSLRHTSPFVLFPRAIINDDTPNSKFSSPSSIPHPISFALDLEMTFHLPTLLPCVWGYNLPIHPAMRFHPQRGDIAPPPTTAAHQHQQYNMTTDGHSMSSSSTRGQKNTTRSTSSSSSAASRTEEQ